MATHEPRTATNSGADPRVPGYELLGELGQGAMGIVYRARQKGLARSVALKVLRGGTVAGSAAVERFRAEAEAVARLHHPNIVQIYEVGEVAGLSYLSLELVEGTNLAQALGGRPQPPELAARLIESLARAIHHAHERGVIHRDLKPGNILLTREGTPKVTDFGLAKVRAGANDDTQGLTRTGDLIGTLQYMAPEQAEGHANEVGPGADIFSLGAILYEWLTGSPPFWA